MITACPLCAGRALTPCFARERVPVFQNVRYDSPAEAAAAATGRLEITHCDGCGFVFNAAFDPALAVYSPRYENDQSVSSVFRAYLDGIGERVLAAVGPGGSPMVLEVGCGQAHFLKRLAAAPEARFTRFVGFDPAWRGGDTDGLPLDIRRQLFDAAAVRELGGAIGAIVSRHVIEHVSDPLGFLREIGAAVQAGGPIKLMIETPSLEWIVRHDVIFDFFYEHCSYFTVETLGFALRRAGFRVLGVETLFEGQYLWAVAELTASPPPAARPAPAGLGEQVARLGRLAEHRVAEIRAQLAAHRRAGAVALWGAGAKGATLAALVDPDAALIDCVIDINPRKQNAWLAMSAHPVVAPEQAAQRGVRTVLLLNPNYRPEVERLVAEARLPFVVLDA